MHGKIIYSKGFTFTEVVIAIAIFMILAGVGVGAYFRYYNFALVDLDVHKVTIMLNKARFLAQKNPSSADYGVHLDPVTSSLTLFKGTYAHSDPDNQELVLGVLHISEVNLNPNPGVTMDIIFENKVGKTVNWGSFKVGNDDYQILYTINPQGVIQ